MIHGYVRGNDAWHLPDARVNKTAVAEYKRDHEAIPPAWWRGETRQARAPNQKDEPCNHHRETP